MGIESGDRIDAIHKAAEEQCRLHNRGYRVESVVELGDRCAVTISLPDASDESLENVRPLAIAIQQIPGVSRVWIEIASAS